MGINGIDPIRTSVFSSPDWTDWNGFSMEHAPQRYKLVHGAVEILLNCLPKQVANQHGKINSLI